MFFIPDIRFELVEQISGQLLIWRSCVVPDYLQAKIKIKLTNYSPVLVAYCRISPLQCVPV